MIDRATQAAIHVGKKALGLDDDTYRALLKAAAGVESSRDLDAEGAAAVLRRMRAAGFEPATKRRAMASQPLARKARALWLALWNLDEIESGSEKSLAAFAERITKKQDLRFCSSPELAKLVEALKAMIERAGVKAEGHGLLDPRRAIVREQWARLHKARWARVSGDWGISSFGHATGCTPNARTFEDFEAEHLDKMAAKLGPIVRSMKLGRRHLPPQTNGAAA